MYTLIKTVEIDSAHFLPNYIGKCANLHGHRWMIKVNIQAKKLNSSGMVMDFTVIKEIVNKLDHETINEFVAVPTAEKIAKYFYGEIKVKLEEELHTELTVGVRETPDSWIWYTEEELF